MSDEVIDKGLELLARNAKEDRDKDFHVMLFGGEPFLVPKKIKYIFDKGLELEKEYKVKFTASAVTNATILTDELINLIKTYKHKVNFNIQLSVDGIQVVQDMYRITKDGRGSFNLVEKNVPKFIELYRDMPRMLAIHGCVNKYSLPYLFESFKYFFEDYRFRSIWFMPVHEENWDENDVEIYREQLLKIKDYIMEKIKETGDQSLKDVVSPLNHCFSGQNRFYVPCGAGRKFISITADGDIYPCHHLFFNDKSTKIGDVFNGIDYIRKTMYEMYDANDMTCDKDCDHYHCYRCIALNYEVKCRNTFI